MVAEGNFTVSWKTVRSLHGLNFTFTGLLEYIFADMIYLKISTV